jgi:hypothetical protein
MSERWSLRRKSSGILRRIEACLETADVSIQGYSSNGRGMAGGSPSELALNTGVVLLSAWRIQLGMFEQGQKSEKFGATHDGHRKPSLDQP